MPHEQTKNGQWNLTETNDQHYQGLEQTTKAMSNQGGAVSRVQHLQKITLGRIAKVIGWGQLYS